MTDPLTLLGNNWLDPTVTGHLSSLSDTLGYSFYTGTWPSYIYSGGAYNSGYTSIVTTGGSFPPVSVTSDQQNLVNYFLSDTLSSVGGFADVQFRDSFSDVSFLKFQQQSGGQIFISSADVTDATAAAATRLPATTNAFNGDGSTTAFTLSFDPVNISNTEVYISGVLQSQSTYSVSGTTLTFNSAPSAGAANIQVNINNGDFAGDIVLDNNGTTGSTVQSQLGVGQQGAEVILHELGHAVGLIHANADPSHSGEPNAGYTGDYATEKFSIMAVTTTSPVHSATHPDMDSTVFATGLQLYDIAAIQSLYGRNYTTRGTDDPGTTGVNEADTTYTWGTFGGVVQAFGAGTTTPFIYTVWDGAGTDVINAAGYDPVELDLRQGHFSAIGKSGIGSAAVVFDHVDGSGNETDHGNVGIAFFAVIENGIGSDGADNLIGNAWNNALYGGAGADDIYGDGLSYDADAGFHTDDTNRPGPSANANLSGDDILLGGTGNDVLVGGKGNDVLHGGYNTSDVDSIVSGWNSAGELPSSSSNISYASDGIDTADYSRLYLSSTSWWTGAQSISAGSHGIDVIFGASEVGIVQKGTIDSTGVGSDGTDHLFSVEHVIGTAGDDRFFGGNGRTSSYSGSDTPLHYYGGAGNDTYTFNFSSDYGYIAIDDSSGTDKVSVTNWGTAFAFNSANLGTSDTYTQLAFLTGGGVAPSLFLNKTQIDAGTSIDYLQFDDRRFDAKAFLDKLATLDPLHTHTVDELGDLVGFTRIADAGSTTLNGGASDDTMDSNGYTVTMVGSTGNDTYITTTAGDFASEAPGGGTDTVQSTVNHTLESNVENLTLTGTADISGTGNSQINIIFGNSGANNLDGAGGNDTLAGGAGNDTYLFGNGSGHDIITDASGTLDIIQFDSTVASSSASYVRNGDDLLIGYGTSGDVATVTSYFTTDSIEEVTFADSTVHDATYISQHLNVQTGSSGDDVLTGTSSDDSLSGLAGNDTLTGLGGNDTLDGGAGADTMIGGTGNDTYVVDNAGDGVTAGTGTDTIKSSITWDMSSAGHNNADVENLTLTGTANLVGTGNSLDNILTANTGTDTLVGGQGNDTYVVSNANDVVLENSGEGTDTIQSSISWDMSSSGHNNTNVENLILTGASALSGTGNGLDNILVSNSGIDTLTGGAGNDTYVVNNTNDVVVETAGNGSDTVQASVTYTLGGAANIERLTLTGTGSINGTGNSLVNIITGNSGDNALDGGGGGDTLIGGTGNDTYSVRSAGDVVTENLGEGTDTVIAYVTYTLPDNVENLTILPGSGATSATGNGLNNVITDSDGGFLILDGGAGADTMISNASSDTFIVDNTGDVVLQNHHQNFGGLIESSVSYTLPTDVYNLTLTGTANINATGNAANLFGTTLTGNSGNNILDDGGAGHCVMVGGAGDDTYYVRIANSSTISENLNEGTDTVVSSVSYALPANVENLTLTGTANINGTGNAVVNVITGNNGNNTLDGGALGDTLIGGGGNDTFIVDNASDVVTAGTGTDTIQSSISWDMSATGHNNSDVENLILTGASVLSGTGNSLDNTITGNTAADTLAGGLGNDTYVITNASTVIVENSGTSTGTDTVQFGSTTAGTTYTLASNVENLTLTDTVAINGTGNTLNNVIVGNSAVNTLTGDLGDDTLDGGAGADIMKGGAGNDTYYVDNTSDVCTESTSGSSGGTDLVVSSVNWTLGTNFENLTLSGSANLNGTGNAVVNVITGNSGNNTLDGGALGDTLIGGGGNDTFIVDNASDVVTAGTGTADTIQSSISWDMSATGHNNSDVENLILTGASVLSGTGTSGDNVITGNTAADTLTGGLGNDTYIITNASTVIVESSGTGTGTDTVQFGSTTAGTTYTLANNVENLTLTGTAAINGTGNSGDNIITGNSGNNTLNGGAGTDTLIGGDGNDTYIVDTTTDTITENSGEGTDLVNSSVTFSLSAISYVENLTLTGTGNINGTGNDLVNVISGNSGNNTLDGGAGADSMIGGTGNDTYVVDSTSEVLTEGLSAGTDTVLSSVTWTLATNFENLTLTGTANINGTGNGVVNVITGNSGDNTLDGGTGADTLIGGGGNDTFIVDNASDVVTAGSGTADTIKSSITWDMSSSTGHNNSEVENLILTGASVLSGTGTSGDNVITGNTAADTLTGGLGNDTYIITNASTVIVENSGVGTGTDAVQFGSTTAGSTYTLAGNVENLTLTGTTAINGTGNALDNIITGNTAVNTLDGGVGADTMMGWGGDDTFIVDNTGDVVTVTPGGGTELVQANVSYTLPTYVDSLTLTGTGNINGTGNDLGNIITGNSGNNTLDGGAAPDIMIGGAGNDTYFVDISDMVTENASAGTDTEVASSSIALAANVENLILASTAGSINGTGNGLVNVITGNSGDNTLDGSTGADTLIGGGGNDTFNVDNASDVVTAGTGTDTIQSSITWDMSSSGHNNSDVENLILTGASVLSGTGNSLDNTITGNTAADTLTGGLGNDTYVITNASTVIVESASAGTDTVQFGNTTAGTTYTLASNVENLTLTGSAAINGTGNSGDNLIVGNTAGNTLNGSSGNDTLDGGDGLDTLTGGTGSDIFLFHSSTAFHNIDIATDFKTTDNDKINVADLLTGYHAGTDNIDDFVQLVTSGANTLLKVDMDGTGTNFSMAQIATLNGITGLNVDTLVANGELIVS